MSSTVDAKKLQADESTNKKIDNRIFPNLFAIAICNKWHLIASYCIAIYLQ